MSAFFVIAAGVIGACVGSFLTVLVPRLYKEQPGIACGRSVCVDTGEKLAWYELIPVVSWVVQRGRSRRSGARIPAWYPVVELLGGIMAAYAVWRLGLSWATGATVGLGWGLLALALYDGLYSLVDRRISVPVIVLIGAFSVGHAGVWSDPLLSAAICGVWFGALYVFGKGAWSGQGDIDFGLILGLCWPLHQVLYGLWGTYVLALVWAGGMYAATKMRPTRVPLGPAAMLVAWWGLVHGGL